jgi:hypothetical protein
MLISTALLLDSNIRNSVCTPAKLPCRRVEVGYDIIHQGREDIFLSRGSLFPEKRSFEGNKEARLKIVFSTVVYIKSYMFRLKNDCLVTIRNLLLLKFTF